MTPYYLHICQSFGFPQDKDLVSRMQKANENELKRLEDKLEDAEKNLGETDISDALIAKAQYLAQIGDKVRHWGMMTCFPLGGFDVKRYRKRLSAHTVSLLTKPGRWVTESIWCLRRFVLGSSSGTTTLSAGILRKRKRECYINQNR